MSYDFSQASTQNVDPFAHLENPNANPELSEKFEENRQEFQENYADKLQVILWWENSELFSKISGSFEQSGNIQDAIESNINQIKYLDKSEYVKESLLFLLSQDKAEFNLANSDILSNNWNEQSDMKQESERERKLLSQKTISKQAKDNLSADLWLAPEEVQEKLEKTDEQNKNKEQMKTIVYNQEFMSQFLWDGKQADENKAFLEHEEVQEDLDIILSKCVLNTDVTTFQEIASTQWEEWIKQVNKSLNYAFDMQVAEILDGKVNYPEEKVFALRKEIYEWNPFEKIEAYEKIKHLVYTNEWMGWAKQSREFKNRSMLANEKQKVLNERFEQVRMLLSQAQEKNTEEVTNQQSKIDEILAMEKEEENSSWDVFSWDVEFEWINDIVNEQKEAA